MTLIEASQIVANVPTHTPGKVAEAAYLIIGNQDADLKVRLDAINALSYLLGKMHRDYPQQILPPKRIQ